MPQAKHAYTTAHYPRELPPQTRVKVEAAIEAHIAAQEALTAFLDALDGDPDLEPSPGIHGDGSSDDREQDAGDEGEKGSDAICLAKIRETICHSQKLFDGKAGPETLPSGVRALTSLANEDIPKRPAPA